MDGAPFQRTSRAAANALASGSSPPFRLPRTKRTMSRTVERMPPAPASVGMSQFDRGLPAASWPGASRARRPSVSATTVLSMPRGEPMRSFTSSS